MHGWVDDRRSKVRQLSGAPEGESKSSVVRSTQVELVGIVLLVVPLDLESVVCPSHDRLLLPRRRSVLRSDSVSLEPVPAQARSVPSLSRMRFIAAMVAAPMNQLIECAQYSGHDWKTPAVPMEAREIVSGNIVVVEYVYEVSPVVPLFSCPDSASRSM